MNVGIAVLLGFYGVAGSFYSELIKPNVERRGGVVAFELTIGLLMAALAAQLLTMAYSNMNNDRE